MNTSTDVTLPPAQADELAELLDMLTGWLTAGAESALADLENHLDCHALFHGGMFDTVEYAAGIEAILPRFTTLIAAYQAMLDRPDIDEGDDW
jgi:hypothetical protein